MVNNKGIIKLTIVNYNTTTTYFIIHFTYLYYSIKIIGEEKINQSWWLLINAMRLAWERPCEHII